MEGVKVGVMKMTVDEKEAGRGAFAAPWLVMGRPSLAVTGVSSPCVRVFASEAWALNVLDASWATE